MKEIGGYIELYKFAGEMLHSSAVKLNSGRNAVEYLIFTKNIKKVLMPKFMCSSCANSFRKHGVQVHYYSIDEKFKPIINMRETDEWLFLVNYYGQFTNEYLANFGKNLIVDNSMAYFQKPLNGVDTFYSCRKYFGVSDGAILYTDIINDDLEQDVSFDRMKFILGRFEKGASEFYNDYVENNHVFSNQPVKRMSKLTENLLCGMDYEFIKHRRTGNFSFLHSKLKDYNSLDLIIPEGAFMYPLLVQNGSEIRKKLQEKKIFIPTLWPAVYNICAENDIEYYYAKNILPLPVDQRYDVNDMEYILKEILECIN